MLRAFISVLLVFGFVAWSVEAGLLENLDVSVMLFVHTLQSDEMTAILTVFSAVFQGELVSVYTIVFVTWLYFVARRKAVAVTVLMTMIATGVTNALAKLAFARIRPEFFRLAEADGFSFPSAHAMHTFVFLCLLGWYTGRKLSVRMERVFIVCGVALIVLATGFSRVYLGVHYPSDIIGGYLLGAAVLLGAVLFLRYTKNDLQFTAEER